MRRLFLISLAFIFGFAVLTTSIVREAQANLWAKVSTDETLDTSNAEPSPSPTPSPEPIDYYLAYPGILPDHPLYFLKMIRDRVRLSLTRDPVKQIELKLLYADKRVGAAQALSEGNKTDLAVTTAAKAENYLFQVIDQLNQLKQKGQDQPQLWERVEKATAKHIEVLEPILEKAPDQAKPVLTQAIEISRRGRDQALEVLGRNQERQQLQEQEEEQEREREQEGDQENETNMEQEQKRQGQDN